MLIGAVLALIGAHNVWSVASSISKINMEKICTKCNISKKLSDYYTTGKPNKSLRGDCKECFNRIHRREWWENSKKYYFKHLAGRNKTIKKLWLSQEFYQEQIALQDWKCKICAEKKKLVVDHCHSTNKFRWLLCNKCNLWIWHLKDDIELVKKAVLYLSI